MVRARADVTPPIDCDVVILGAGPAGSVAALKLLGLGYRVVIIERARFPRPQIGEALTPGVRDLLEPLGVADALPFARKGAMLPMRRRWHSQDAELAPQAPYTMVDRTELDRCLLQQAGERGALCMQPARAITIEEHCEGVRVEVREESAMKLCHASYLLDARGRRRMRESARCAPPLLALWSEVSGALSREEILLEALPDGWLWGAPMQSRYRIMAFCDPATPRRHHTADPGGWLQAQLQQSVLFRPMAASIERHRWQACDASAYRNVVAPAPRHLRLGDTAFALDPLSSSGVEKAMRFSLQGALAVHTMLSEPADASLAHEFLEARVHESVAQHAQWTQEAYAAAWPSSQHAFWQARAQASAPLPLAPSEPESIGLAVHVAAGTELRALLRCPLQLSPGTRFVELPCVIGDRIRRHRAVTHPRLPRPVAFVGNLGLERLLLAITGAHDLGQWLSMSALTIPREQALRIADWLLRTELVCARQPS